MERPIEKVHQDMESKSTLLVCVPLSACPTVQVNRTVSKLTVAPQIQILARSAQRYDLLGSDITYDV